MILVLVLTIKYLQVCSSYDRKGKADTGLYFTNIFIRWEMPRDSKANS